ncbi:MAG: GGDEF domain-containing protein [Brevinematales bacterium]
MDSFNNLKKIFDNLWEGIYILDENRKIIYWNSSAENITGFKENEVVGKSCSDNILRHIDFNGNELCIKGCPMQLVINGKDKIEAEVFLHHKAGYRILVKVQGIRLTDRETNKILAAEFFYPIIIRNSNIENDIIKEAFFDNLTGALNRNGFEKLFFNRFREMEMLNKKTGFIFADLDNFKKINDEYGHDVGDKILISFTQTIKNSLRQQDLICRWGGEEFLIVVFIDRKEMLENICKRFKMLIESNFLEINDKIIRYTASFGATLFEKDYSIEEIIKKADHLMYEVKKSGKNGIKIDT